MGYGGGYRYPHEFEGHYVAERYLPEAIAHERIVELSESGLEKVLGERWRALVQAAKGGEEKAEPERDAPAPGGSPHGRGR